MTLIITLRAGKTLDLAVAENAALSKPRVYHFRRVTMYLSTEPPAYDKRKSDNNWACPEDIAVMAT